MTATPIWQLLVEPAGAPGLVNMARDLELLERAEHEGTATLRLYRFNPPCFSIGRNQTFEPQEMEYVRRPTGGGALWHDDALTYAVTAPIALFGSLRGAYCEIHKRIAAALRVLGADPVLAPDHRGSGLPRWCFERAVGGEILVAGRKVVGSAQRRKRTAFLQHGSVKIGEFEEVANAIRDTWPVRPSDAFAV